jgi:hypothetical protein
MLAIGNAETERDINTQKQSNELKSRCPMPPSNKMDTSYYSS